MEDGTDVAGDALQLPKLVGRVVLAPARHREQANDLVAIDDRDTDRAGRGDVPRRQGAGPVFEQRPALVKGRAPRTAPAVPWTDDRDAVDPAGVQGIRRRDRQVEVAAVVDETEDPDRTLEVAQHLAQNLLVHLVVRGGQEDLGDRVVQGQLPPRRRQCVLRALALSDVTDQRNDADDPALTIPEWKVPPDDPSVAPVAGTR